MLVCIQGWSLSEAPARAEARAGPVGGSWWWGWMLARVLRGCAERVVVTFAMKNP